MLGTTPEDIARFFHTEERLDKVSFDKNFVEGTKNKQKRFIIIIVTIFIK